MDTNIFQRCFGAFSAKLLRFLGVGSSEQRRRESYLLQLPDERFKAVKDQGAYGYVDSENNELLIPCAYDYADCFVKALRGPRRTESGAVSTRQAGG